MTVCSLDNEKNLAKCQMITQNLVDTRMSREEMLRISEALPKAGINGLVHEMSIGVRKRFG